MTMARALPALVLVALGLAGCTTTEQIARANTNDFRRASHLPPLTTAQFRAARTQANEDQARFEAEQDRGAGFVPAAELAAQGVDVRRARYKDPMLFLRLPGITLTRSANGEVRVIATSDGRAPVGEAPVPAAEWDRLVAQDAATFVPPPPITRRHVKAGDPILTPPPVCHAWGVGVQRIAHGKLSTTNGHGCGDDARSRAALDYAAALIRIATTYIPRCQDKVKDRASPFSALPQCFGQFAPHTTTDP